MRLSAEFKHLGSIERAVEALVSAGFNRSSIDLYSFQPVELRPGVLERPSRMSLFAVAGAILSGTAATAWIFWTQHDYPLVTGGMPISSGWATGVITYETTMAGAVAGILVGFLIEGGYLRKRRRGPAAALDSDAVFLEVSCPEEQYPLAEKVLREAGASHVRREEEPA